MTDFDVYAFADYSGAKSQYNQKKSIALSVIRSDVKKPQTTKCFTRESLRNEIKLLLIKAGQENQRVIFGFDHSYSFPVGFYDVVTGTQWKKWEQLLDLLCHGTSELPSVNNEPREWAKAANDCICKRLSLSKGPFWGPNFVYQNTNPKFPFDKTPLKEKRLSEERIPRTKPIYKIGGIGSVGLQSLYGIQHLAWLMQDLENNSIKLFRWPYDGWELPFKGHVLIEVYPSLVNEGLKSDENDAEACSKWLYRQDRDNNLKNLFKPKLTKNEWKRASLEGWIIGIQ